MKISQLKINPNNPQKFDDLTALKRSIEEFPKMMELRPMIFDPDTMFVLGGNKRLLCLQELGYKEIPDNWVLSASNLTDEEKKRFILADNIGFGEWDLDMLRLEFSEFTLPDLGLKLDSDIDYGEGDEGSNDIEQVNNFNESINFTIKCDSIKQLEELQNKLNTGAKKIYYKDFLIKAGL